MFGSLEKGMVPVMTMTTTTTLGYDEVDQSFYGAPFGCGVVKKQKQTWLAFMTLKCV